MYTYMNKIISTGIFYLLELYIFDCIYTTRLPLPVVLM